MGILPSFDQRMQKTRKCRLWRRPLLPNDMFEAQKGNIDPTKMGACGARQIHVFFSLIYIDVTEDWYKVLNPNN